MKNHFLFLLFLLVSFNSISYGQAFDKSNELLRMTNIPNSPEAQAFTQYGNIDVGLYTGTPNIQIPIYVYKGRELDLPLSLNYDASGIKVEQEATNVGLGWSLNVGGRISRLVNGLPDDYLLSQISHKTLWHDEVQEKILLYAENHNSFPDKAAAIQYLEFLKKINDNEYDALPDYFSFNALGYSDMFVIDVENRIARSLNNPRIKILLTLTSQTPNTPGSIISWTVIMDDGTRFVFSQSEITDTEHFDDTSPESLHARHQRYNSSWVLKHIYSSTGKDHYEFFYNYLSSNLIELSTQKALITSVVNYTQTPNPSPTGNPNFVSVTNVAGENKSIVKTKELGLVEIKHNQKTIVDIDLKNRFDLNYQYPSAVNEIRIMNNGQLHRAFTLYHDYFKISSSINPASTPYKNIRLKLDSLNVKDSNNIKVHGYGFEYIDEDQLPETNSKSQDYYGYFNDAPNTDLFPKTTHEYVTDGGDRSVSFINAKKGTLNKIIYPTGGYTSFEYEPHKSTQVTPTEVSENTYYSIKASLTLQGGVVCDGFFNNCPDSECITNDCQYYYFDLGGVDGPPKVEHKVFYIDVAGDYLYNCFLTDNNAGSTNSSIPGQQIIFFKRDDITTSNPYSMPPPLDIENIMDYPNQGGILQSINNLYENSSSSEYSYTNQPITLQPGYYQVTLINPRDNSSLFFQIGKYETINTTNGGEAIQIEKAGMRIKRIEDYTENNTLALKKEYEYSDGIIISQPIYEYLISDYTVEDFWSQQGVVMPPMLYRNSYASGTDKPHIGYETVKEHVIDFNDNQNKLTTTSDFYTTNWGNYFNGVYSYYINGKETARNYGVNYKLGKPKQVNKNGSLYVSTNNNLLGTGLKYIQTYEYDNSQFYQNKGVYARVEDTRNHLYSVPQPHPTGGTWFIGYLNPKLVASLNSVLLAAINNSVSNGVIVSTQFDDSSLGTPGEVYYAPPDDCLPSNLNIQSDLCSTSLGRLSLQVASAYGKAGYITESVDYQRKGGVLYPDNGLLDNSLKQTTSYSYYPSDETTNLDFLLKSQTTSIYNEKNITKEFFYPDNFTSEYSNLRTNNIINNPVETRTYSEEDNNTTLISRQKTDFSGIRPSKIKTAKGNNNLEERLLFEIYKHDNLVQAKQVNGIPISYIWGYDKKYVVAMIENATYDQIEALNSFGQDFIISQGLSNQQIIELRSLGNTQVTTYTYEPMVGVTSITDPRGDTVYYEYDDFHRLKFIKDKDGYILSKNEYNYKN